MRTKQIYISEENEYFLQVLAKAATAGTTAKLTPDEIADNILRNTITRDHPELALLYEEFKAAKQSAKKSYAAIEEKALKAVSSPKI